MQGLHQRVFHCSPLGGRQLARSIFRSECAAESGRKVYIQFVTRILMVDTVDILLLNVRASCLACLCSRNGQASNSFATDL